MTKEHQPDFLAKWIGDGRQKARLDKLNKHAIESDKWDRQDLERLTREVPELGEADDRITGVSDTGHHALGDVFFGLSKSAPQDIPPEEMLPSFLINRQVSSIMKEMKELQELRNYTVGDPIGSALGTISMEPDVEIAFDRLKEEQKLQKQLKEKEDELGQKEEEERTLDQMYEEWMNGEGPEPQDFQKNKDLLQRQMEALREQIGEEAQDLQNQLNNKKSQIQQDMKHGIQKAKDQAQEMEAAGMLWGQEPGAITHMPVAERLALANKIKDNVKFKRMAELIGPMTRLAFAEQSRKTEFGRDELYDITIGNDLARVLPLELSAIRNPQRKKEFMKKFIEGELLQYELRGEEKVAKGGIYFCEDGSGSMSGDKEIWAKAVGLCLLHVARSQNRAFYGIHFGSPRQFKTFDFRDPKNIDPDKVMEFAALFFAGGTDFVTPLSVALDLLKEEFDSKGHVNGDIVFCTDGMCGVPEDFMKQFKQEQARLGFRLFGINVGGNYKDEPLYTLADHKVCEVTRLLKGDDLRDIFSAI
jgi:uncharacterized protein with von Willebrand factor type A (vWA) domain